MDAYTKIILSLKFRFIWTACSVQQLFPPALLTSILCYLRGESASLNL